MVRPELQAILRHPAVFRAGQRAGAAIERGFTTGHAALDEALPWGGWPRRGLVEILHARPGGGECTLLAPLLRALAVQGRASAWIAPPWLPYAPALVRWRLPAGACLIIEHGIETDMCWAAETCLRSAACGVVLCWLPQPENRTLRRLQLAAEDGAAPAVLFRPPGAAAQPSPAVLRLAIQRHSGARFTVNLLKCRGRTPCAIQLPDDFQHP